MRSRAQAACPVVGGRDDPACHLLPSALAAGRAGPDIAAVILCEVARRLGWPVGVVGNPHRLYLAHAGLGKPILLDPAIGELVDSASLEEPRRWCCALPLDEDSRWRAERRLVRRRSCLN